MRSHQVLRRSSMLSLPRMMSWVAIGTATSKVDPDVTPKNSGGVTPTIVNMWPSRRRLDPIALAEA